MLTKEDYDIVEVIALTDRPMFMDDNAKPHRTRIVQHFSYSNSMACDVARHEPYRACMGLYWPKN